jgi:hypothetical protein
VANEIPQPPCLIPQHEGAGVTCTLRCTCGHSGRVVVDSSTHTLKCYHCEQEWDLVEVVHSKLRPTQKRTKP